MAQRTKTALDVAYSLGDQVFGAQKRFSEGQFRSQAEGIIEKLVIYNWPAEITNDDKLAVLAYLTAYGKSESESPSQWASWTFSYLVLCFPEFQGSLARVNSREYDFKRLPLGFIKAVVDVCHQAEEVEGSGDDQKYDELVKTIPDLAHFPELTATSVNFPPDLAASQVVPAIYGYASLLLFLAGKKISEKNAITITERRPQNLIDTYKINESAAFILKGEGRMGSEAHSYVNQAWVTYAAARIAFISEVATFGNGATLPQRVIYTVTKLLENSGMQPAFFIHRFLQAFPQCASYSCIRPSLNAYASSIKEVAGSAPHLQPYYKLIYGDGTRAFHRNSLIMLSACAIAYEKHTSPSMRNFNLGEGATVALAMFDAEAARKGDVTLQSLTFATEHEDNEAE